MIDRALLGCGRGLRGQQSHPDRRHQHRRRKRSRKSARRVQPRAWSRMSSPVGDARADPRPQIRGRLFGGHVRGSKLARNRPDHLQLRRARGAPRQVPLDSRRDTRAQSALRIRYQQFSVSKAKHTITSFQQSAISLALVIPSLRGICFSVNS
jgi:hypothetical protein